MKSVILSTGDVYFEGITKDLIKITSVKKETKNDTWFFSLFGKTVETYNYPSEGQAKKDQEKLLLFISQCKSKKGGDK